MNKSNVKKQSKWERFKNLFSFEDGQLRFNRLLIVLLFVYIISAFLLFGYYQYILTSDSVSYITIANEYALQSPYAINGYWSPLYSWLLAIFVIFGKTPLYMLHVAKILSIIIGFITLIGLNLLFSKFISDDKHRLICLIIMVPNILLLALYWVTPDLLLICILLFYFNIIFDPKYSTRLLNGVSCGLLGSLAYFSKTYAFFFFICHFIIFNFYFYLKTNDKIDRKKIKMNCFIGLVIFLAVSGVWIGIISDKYNEITLGTSGTYNQAVMGPGPGHPPFYQGLIAPPNPMAKSSWEDPSYYKITEWNPLGSTQDFIFQLNIIVKNIVKTLEILTGFSVLSLLILLGTLIFIWKNRGDKEAKNKMIYLTVTVFLFIAGYLLIYIDSRYLGIILILILIMGMCLFEALYRNKLIQKRVLNLLIIVLIVSFTAIPVQSLYENVNVNKISMEEGTALKTEFNVHGNIASNNEWIYSIVLSYFIESKYYGMIKPNENLTEIENELKTNNIDYYLVWGSNDTVLPYTEITNGKFYKLKVYKLKNVTN